MSLTKKSFLRLLNIFIPGILGLFLIVFTSIHLNLSNKKASTLETRQIEVTLTEGTNMAAVLSPDRQYLAIDILGRIWLLPATGGVAKAITDPLGDARQPAWSPDGRQIAFQAYRDGNWHIWTVRRDGTVLTQHTHGYFDHREPHWSPDGTQLVFSSDRSGNYDIWMLEFGSKKTTQITKETSNEFAPALSPDGMQIAYASDQKDKEGIWLWSKKDGAKSQLATQSLEATHPSWSPDGKKIAFNVFSPGRSSLQIIELNSKNAKPAVLTNEAEDHFPFRASWISNNELIYTGTGKIRKRLAKGSTYETIPFAATVQLDRHVYPTRKRDFDPDGPLAVKGIVQPMLSPDGSKLLFNALRDLWIQGDGKTAQQLTHDPYVELNPTFSPDGKSLAYISDKGGDMAIWIQEIDSGNIRQIGPITISGMAGIGWSPDGKQIALATSAGPRSGQLWIVNIATGKTEKVGGPLPSSASIPTWLADGKTIALGVLKPYSSRFREGLNRVLFLSADGGRRWVQEGLEHWSIGNRMMDGPYWSSDGKWMACISGGLLWIVPVDVKGQPIGPPKRLSNELADMPSWAGDSKSLIYIATDKVKRVWIETGMTKEIPIQLNWNRTAPNGRTIIQAGHVFDGRSSQLKEKLDIIIEGNRIVAIEAHDPNRKADQIINAMDAYVLPGLIDMHSHQGSWDGEKLGRAWLAWGVTSTRDPTTDPYDALNRREAREAGLTRGPRIFYTGPPIDGNRIYYNGAITQQAPAQLKLELNRAEKLDYDMIKTYVRLADPLQKLVVERAHQIGVPVSSHELYPSVAYGTDGVEHVEGTSRRGYSPKISSTMRSYQDVIDLISKSGMSFTPTVGIYGAYNYLLAKDSSILSDRRMLELAPPFLLFDARNRIQTVSKDPEYWQQRFLNMTSTIKRVSDAGGTLIAGTDSPIVPFGMSLHMELEAYVEAGLSPYQALQTATLNAAKALRMEEELGTIEIGKLADLIIVQDNPLENIRHIRMLKYVIQNGKVYILESLFE